jgi:2-oxoglutarate/2-oxoacid ferredoxin oxidoreductase subunit beta
MTTPVSQCVLRLLDENYTLDDYKSALPRWCVGCGDHGVLTAIQRLCRDEKLPPEKTVFVSGIGCSSRFPHYMKTYGFHGLHGRALPVAEGVKVRRPDLHVFVVMGDGDCCSIGTAHWIHAIRYNMDMTVLMLDNGIYGLTKNQASPTSPQGLVSNTTPRGAYLEPINPLSVTLSVPNVSFVAQTADWLPDLTRDIIGQAFHHRGFSFVRVLQRCPEYLDTRYDPWIQDPARMLILTHEDGIQLGPDLARIYTNREAHDPADRSRAQEVATVPDPIPVGVVYRNTGVPCYEDLMAPDMPATPAEVTGFLERELDKFTIDPAEVGA